MNAPPDLRMSPHYRFRGVGDFYQVIKAWAVEWLPPPRAPVMIGLRSLGLRAQQGVT
jgi:hypothetical protein